MDKASVAFLAETFHTEVLEFLIELHREKYNLIIYNNQDKYDNISVCKHKYPNLEVKSLGHFLKDLMGDVFLKCYMVSFDNVIIPEMLEEYKTKLVYFAHSMDHVSLYARNSLEFISITPQLCMDNHVNYMLPVHNANNQPLISQLSNPDSQIRVMCIGEFSADTKNMAVVGTLLNSGIQMHVFSRIRLPVIEQIEEKYPSLFYFYFRKSTKEVFQTIAEKNINFMLFSPKLKSEYFTRKWSGCMAFAYTNNIPLILPEELGKTFNMQGHVEYNDDDLPSLPNQLHEYMKDYSSGLELMKCFCKKVHERNSLMRAIVLGEGFEVPTITCTMSEYGGIFVDGTDGKDDKGRMIVKHTFPEKKLLQIVASHVDGISHEKPVIVVSGSYIGASPLALLNLSRNTHILSFEESAHVAKMQKKTLVLNNLTHRAQIYNNLLGHKVIQDARIEDNTLDMLTIDSVQLDRMDVLKIEQSNMTEMIIYGARRTIARCHPMIIYPSGDMMLTNDLKTELQVTDTIEFFDVSKFLMSVGYNKSEMRMVDSTVVWPR
jgi:hypothetical protein